MRLALLRWSAVAVLTSVVVCACSSSSDDGGNGAAGSTAGSGGSTGGSGGSNTSGTGGAAGTSGTAGTGGAAGASGSLLPAVLADNGDGTLSDSANGFMWEKDREMGAWTAYSFYTRCDSFPLASKSGWRAPTIDELRTLIVGCPATMPGGACPASQSCLQSGCVSDSACMFCAKLDQDAGEGCYMSPLFGSCVSHWAKGVVFDFDTAAIWSTVDKTDPHRLLRCVRDQ